MTEVDTRVSRAQMDLVDSLLHRLIELEDALRSADIPLPDLDPDHIRAREQWIKARETQRQAELQDPRR